MLENQVIRQIQVMAQQQMDHSLTVEEQKQVIEIILQQFQELVEVQHQFEYQQIQFIHELLLLVVVVEQVEAHTLQIMVDLVEE